MRRSQNSKTLITATALTALTAFGLLLRWWWITNIPTEQLYDFSTYYEVARNVAHGLGYTFQGQPIAFQGMGYSYGLGLYFRLIGNDSEMAAKVLNVLMSTATIPFVYHLTTQFSRKMSSWVPWGAALIAAFLPQHIAYCSSVGTEVTASFLLVLTLWVQVSGMNDRVRLPLLGVLTAAMALVKPFYMAYPVILGLSEWLMHKDWKRAVVALVVTTVCMWLIIAPWAYRNYHVFGRFIPISYNSGSTLYWNNNSDNVHGGFMKLTDIKKTPELQAAIDRELNYGHRSVKLASNLELVLGKEAKRWIVSHPATFAQLAVIRVHSTFFSGTWDIDAWTFNKLRGEQKVLSATDYTRAVNTFRSVNDMLLSLLSSCSLLFSLYYGVGLLRGTLDKRQYPSWAVVPTINMAFLVAVYMVYEGQPRYNFPVLFLMGIMLCFVLEAFTKQGRAV